MIEQHIWNKRILEDLDEFSDLSFQESVWIKNEVTNIVSWPAEAFCRLFDDHQFEHWLTNVSLSKEQKDLSKHFIQVIDLYFSNCCVDDPKQMLKDPKWHDVVEKAKTLKASLEAED